MQVLVQVAQALENSRLGTWSPQVNEGVVVTVYSVIALSDLVLVPVTSSR